MDKTSGKEKAILALTTLYFMYDPRSPYQIETNEEARLEAIKEETGLDKNWRPDKYFLAGVPIYQKLTNTTSAIMLASNRKVVEKTRNGDETTTYELASMVNRLAFSELSQEEIAKRFSKAFGDVLIRD